MVCFFPQGAAREAASGRGRPDAVSRLVAHFDGPRLLPSYPVQVRWPRLPFPQALWGEICPCARPLTVSCFLLQGSEWSAWQITVFVCQVDRSFLTQGFELLFLGVLLYL